MLKQTDKLQKQAKKRIDALEYSNKYCDKDYGKIGYTLSSNIEVIRVLSERKQGILDQKLKKSINQELFSVKVKTKRQLELLQIYSETLVALRKLICLINLFYQHGFFEIIKRNIPSKKIIYQSNKTSKVDKLCRLYNNLCKIFQTQVQYETMFKEEYLESTRSIEKWGELVQKKIPLDTLKIENIDV